jgi:hypothetical protein
MQLSEELVFFSSLVGLTEAAYVFVCKRSQNTSTQHEDTPQKVGYYFNNTFFWLIPQITLVLKKFTNNMWSGRAFPRVPYPDSIP